MGFFNGFSRRAEADSAARQKRDSRSNFRSLKAPFSAAMAGAPENF
jgi:hypothetical protein